MFVINVIRICVIDYFFLPLNVNFHVDENLILLLLLDDRIVGATRVLAFDF